MLGILWEHLAHKMFIILMLSISESVVKFLVITYLKNAPVITSKIYMCNGFEHTTINCWLGWCQVYRTVAVLQNMTHYNCWVGWGQVYWRVHVLQNMTHYNCWVGWGQVYWTVHVLQNMTHYNCWVGWGQMYWTVHIPHIAEYDSL